MVTPLPIQRRHRFFACGNARFGFCFPCEQHRKEIFQCHYRFIVNLLQNNFTVLVHKALRSSWSNAAR
jgi:hypothetical protein